MFVLGFGLGMVMQVLVLAVQNAVDYRDLGVATAGATLFRSIGGSIGVSLFGAIFANRLASELAQVVPPGVPVPPVSDVGAVHALPAELQGLVLDAFVAALHPVFLTAAVLGAAAFVLSWFLPGVPLRKTTEADGLGESFASPRDDDSFRELERAVSVLSRRDERWDVYSRLGARAGLELAPPSLWLLGRLGERPPAAESELAGELGTDPADAGRRAGGSAGPRARRAERRRAARGAGPAGTRGARPLRRSAQGRPAGAAARLGRGRAARGAGARGRARAGLRQRDARAGAVGHGQLTAGPPARRAAFGGARAFDGVDRRPSVRRGDGQVSTTGDGQRRPAPSGGSCPR